MVIGVYGLLDERLDEDLATDFDLILLLDNRDVVVAPLDRIARLLDARLFEYLIDFGAVLDKYADKFY